MEDEEYGVKVGVNLDSLIPLANASLWPPLNSNSQRRRCRSSGDSGDGVDRLHRSIPIRCITTLVVITALLVMVLRLSSGSDSDTYSCVHRRRSSGRLVDPHLGKMRRNEAGASHDGQSDSDSVLLW